MNSLVIYCQNKNNDFCWIHQFIDKSLISTPLYISEFNIIIEENFMESPLLSIDIVSDRKFSPVVISKKINSWDDVTTKISSYLKNSCYFRMFIFDEHELPINEIQSINQIPITFSKTFE